MDQRRQTGGQDDAAELPKRIENWSLTSLQQRLVRAGERLVKHARLLLAESHLTRRLFEVMLRRIAALPLLYGVAQAVAAEKSVKRRKGRRGV